MQRLKAVKSLAVACGYDFGYAESEASKETLIFYKYNLVKFIAVYNVILEGTLLYR